VLDRNVILIAALRFAQRLFQHSLTAVTEFIFVCSQINHLFQVASFLTENSKRPRRGRLNEIPSSAHRFDALMIFAVAFPGNRNLHTPCQAIRWPALLPRYYAAAATLFLSNTISPSRADTWTVSPGFMSPSKSFIASGF